MSQPWRRLAVSRAAAAVEISVNSTPGVPTRTRSPARTGARSRTRAHPQPAGLDIVRKAARTAVDKKGRQPLALDLRDLDGVCDYFLIVSGSSEVQVKAIADAVQEKLREVGVRPWHVEGLEGRRWVLLDYVDLVVHVFHHRTREYYLLERLWGDARKVDLGLDPAD